jgi:hypothetical protein
MDWVKNLSNLVSAAGSRLLFRRHPEPARAAWLIGPGTLAATPSNHDWQQPNDRLFAGISLHSLIHWLEAQPAERSYEYTAPDRCALAQYLKDLGYSVLDSSIDFGPEPQSDDEGFWLYEIVRTQPWTFGAALARARKTALTARGMANTADAPSGSAGVPWSIHV